MVSSLSHAWRALRHRNFKLFFFGQSISLLGTWMTRLATSWLVYRLTHSALLLGVVGFSGQILTFALGPFAGVWIERLNRRKLLVWTQAAAAVQSLAMAGLTLAHIITIPEIIALSALQGMINSFDIPGRQSFLVQMVDDRADLGNAIAINSSMANGARLIGPAIAGVLIAVSSEGWCFLIDGVSYFAVIASLLMMRIRPLEIKHAAISKLEQMREGWDYGGALILFGLSHTLWLSLLLMVFAGFGMLQTASASNTVIQTLVPEDKRGRVMGYYTMAFVGSAPFGSLLAGGLAHWVGAPHTVMITGSFCLAGSMWFTAKLPKVRAVMRPIYQEMGILPGPEVDLATAGQEPG